MTDGYVGNDMEIVAEVQKHPNARVFSFGIGQSVNRFLLDKMAEVSRGEVEYVALNDDGSAAARRFHERVRTPLLTDLSIDWNGLPVADIYPARLPDLFSAKPVIVTGRYGVPASGVIRLRGKRAGEDFVREIKVNLPASEDRHDVLASLWARQKIDDLMARDYAGIQQGTTRKDVKEEITQLGLDFHLMTQFTSFVAVEEMTVAEGGQPRLIHVPVEMPEGVSPEGVFGKPGEVQYAPASAPMAANKAMRQSGAVGGGIGSGSGGGIGTNQASINGRVVRELKDEEADRIAGVRVDRPATWEARLDPGLLRVVKCHEAEVMQPLRRGQCKLSGASKLEVEVWLTEKSDANLAKLRALGFEVKLDPKTSKLIIGRVTVARLAQLARLDVVRYIAPHHPAALTK
jgi:Ca-activated chloride channel family protein